MPGIAGVWSSTSDERAASGALEGMLRVMARGAQAAVHLIELPPGGAIGAIARPGDDVLRQTASVGDSHIVFEGELYGIQSHAGGTAANAAATPPSDALTLLEGYLRDGAKFLRGLEGRFNAAIWNAERRELALVADKFGSKPFYYCQRGSQLAFASEIKSMLTLPWLPRDLNRRGLVQFFAFGQLWNDDTFYTAVKCPGPACVATFDVKNAKLRIERYWRPQPTTRDSAAASLDRLDAALKAAVDDRTIGADRLGLSLSGGLDARTVLGLIEPAGPRPTCVSLGMEGSLDQRSARQLAELAGCEYQTFVLGQGFLADFDRHLSDMVALTDGHYLSQCIVMPTLPLYAKLGIRTLLRGHAGELVHLHKAYNFSMDSSIDFVGSPRMLHEWLYPRLQSHLTAGVPEALISGVGHDEFASLAHESLTTGLEDAQQWDHPVDRVSQLFLDQRTHRETAMSLAKIGSVVEIRIPYLDGRFVEAVFAAPVDLRSSERSQTYMLRNRRPEFLKPPNSNTGAPVGASRAWRAFCYYRMKVLAKLGVRGYQPYERLGLWLRRELRPSVERILLAPECLDRGVLEPDAIRGAVERHAAGEANHTFLLMAMMILETGFRQLTDWPGPAHGAGPPPKRSPVIA